MKQLPSQWTETFKNYEPQISISYLELDCKFSRSEFIFSVDNWLNLSDPQGLEHLQVGNALGCSIQDADILLVSEHGGGSTKSDVFPERLGGLTVLLESFQDMSICLTDIARLAAWTQQFVNDTTLERLFNWNLQ